MPASDYGQFDSIGINPGGSNVGPVIASAATIAPTAFAHHVSGTVAIATITPPYTGFLGLLCLIPDAAFTTVTTDNIGTAQTAVIGELFLLFYDGTKWYPGNQ